MYKISDVSKVLNIPAYKVIELMVNEGEVLKKNIKFIDGVRQIDDEGLSIIKRMLDIDISQEIFKGNLDVEAKSEENLINKIVKDEVLVEVEYTSPIDINDAHDLLETSEIIERSLDEKRKEKIEVKGSNGIIYEHKKELYELDQEIKRLNYAINSYIEIINEDMLWLKDEENILIEKVKVLNQLSKDENQKGFIKNLFKK